MKRYLRRHWYGVQLLFESIVANTQYDQKTYEESIIIVRANSSVKATIIAEEKARNAEVEYLNVYNEQVNWRFLKTIDVYEIIDNDLKQGTEVFCRYIIGFWCKNISAYHMQY